MWPLTTRAAQALVQSHGMTVRATAYGTFGTLEIPISGGEVKSDAKSHGLDEHESVAVAT